MISFLKNFIQKNSWIFYPLRFVPYSIRLGGSYKEHDELIVKYDKMTENEKELFHFQKLKQLLDFVYLNNEFYRSFYDSKGYHPSQFNKLSEFSLVPIVTKSDLKKFQLEKRSQTNSSPLKVNTGGTSGEPLEFYLDKRAFAREWAYMHKIWSTLGYSYLDTKLTFRGKNNGGEPLRYNVVHNEYIVDAYVSFDVVVKAIDVLKSEIKYLHGYPSSIYAFCMFLREHEIDGRELFGNKLKGVLLGSEYPAPKYRELIEATLKVPTISWYGHSEMSILAYEQGEDFTYFPFQTYGYTEAVKCISGESKLIGTSYYNYNSPFVRYDTGDRITDEEFESGILKSFKISSGRVGDIIFDKNGNPISLTALIFGRHHDAFNVIEFLQVFQSKDGFATLCITSINPVNIDMFDLKNIDMDFEIKIMETPFKTAAGKVPLLIS
ncbi:phenylacetate--CoA ligase family protein [Vibrio cyclitrophicus]|uniref:hypothetical protein n=1 Tax=Vibrio cyclitrophicus TaxID=47951 RepID=UPI0002FB6AD3|nr:hypothetical protein [Vibrio cyclitrophicus]OEF45133.1 hypothetical protein OAC_19255 [Vibrio cyclitrophicus 1F273]